MLARNPTGRMGTPEEVANAVVFLTSPRASFITGTNLIIDGALTSACSFRVLAAPVVIARSTAKQINQLFDSMPLQEASKQMRGWLLSS